MFCLYGCRYKNNAGAVIGNFSSPEFVAETSALFIYNCQPKGQPIKLNAALFISDELVGDALAFHLK